MQKLQPIPADALPKGLKGVCQTFVRDLNAANLTPEQVRTALEIIDQWCEKQLDSLPETAAGAST